MCAADLAMSRTLSADAQPVDVASTPASPADLQLQAAEQSAAAALAGLVPEPHASPCEQAAAAAPLLPEQGLSSPPAASPGTVEASAPSPSIASSYPQPVDEPVDEVAVFSELANVSQDAALPSDTAAGSALV